MATIKSHTDIEQSKKLVELGLEPDTADMYYTGHICVLDPKVIELSRLPDVRNEYIGFDHFDIFFPCWSLAALLDVLQIYTTPTAFSTNISVPSLTKTKNGYSITYVGDYRIMESNNNGIEAPIEIIADNSIDSCVKMIEKLHKLKLI